MIGVGCIVAGLVLAADVAVGVGLRGMSAAEVFTGRDPVAGPVYYGLVGFTAVAPWWFSHDSACRPGNHRDPDARLWHHPWSPGCRPASDVADVLRDAEAPDNMTVAVLSGIAPLFISRDVPTALEFYRDQLGFAVTFQGPEPDDIFFGIVQRGAAMIMLKDVGVDPVPNRTRDVGKGVARWDAYVHTADPDALAAEFAGRGVTFFTTVEDTEDGLRGFEIRDADGYVVFFGRPRPS